MTQEHVLYTQYPADMQELNIGATPERFSLFPICTEYKISKLRTNSELWAAQSYLS